MYEISVTDPVDTTARIALKYLNLSEKFKGIESKLKIELNHIFYGDYITVDNAIEVCLKIILEEYKKNNYKNKIVFKKINKK